MRTTTMQRSKSIIMAALLGASPLLQSVDSFTSTAKLRGVGRNTQQHDSTLSLLPKNMLGILMESMGSSATNRKTPTTSSSSTSIYSSSVASFLGTAAPFGITGGSAATFATLLQQEGAADPSLEAQVLTDMSHLGLDLAAFLGPGMIVLRLAVVAGRLLAMAADYIPDHSMLPEELIFQLFMLTVACVGLAKASLLPTFAALNSKVTVKDGKAFRSLFAPAGTSWAQFKALSVCAFDWIDVQQGDIVTTDEKDKDEDEYVYWLYSGSITVESAGATLYNVSCESRGGGPIKENAGRGLLGERRLLRRLGNDKSGSGPRTTVRVTSEEGAKLLRIHTPSLKLLMDNDAEFAESIRTLLFQGMEAKLNAQLLEQAASRAANNELKAANVTA